MSQKATIAAFCQKVISDNESITAEGSKLFDPDISLSGPLGEQVGIDGLIETLTLWLDAFLDSAITKMDLSEKNHTVVALWGLKGIYKKTAGINGNAIHLSGVGIWEFNDEGRVRSLSYQMDMLSFYKQLGFFLQKDVYPNQSLIKSNEMLLVKTLSNFGGKAPVLTDCEVRALALYINGLTAKHVAEYLGCSFRTIQVHIAKAMKKLQCKQKNELMERVAFLQLKHIFRDLADLLTKEPGSEEALKAIF